MTKIDILRPQNLAHEAYVRATSAAKVAFYGGITLTGVGCKALGIGDDILHMRHVTPAKSSVPDHIEAIAAPEPVEIEVEPINIIPIHSGEK